MITMEMIGKIRQMFFRNKMSRNTIRNRSLFRHQHRDFPATCPATLTDAPRAFNSRYMVVPRFQCLI